MLYVLGSFPLILSLSTLSVGPEKAVIPEKAVRLEKEKNKSFYESGIEFAKKLSVQKPPKDLKGEDGQEQDPKACCRVSPDLKKSLDAPHNPPTPSSEELLLFVSFSMPKASLQNLTAEVAQKAEKKDFVPKILLRGLVGNSFKKMGEAMKEMSYGMDIDPKAFENYQVTKVPTFILVRGGKEVARLSGNVSLAFAREKLEDVH